MRTTSAYQELPAHATTITTIATTRTKTKTKTKTKTTRDWRLATATIMRTTQINGLRLRWTTCDESVRMASTGCTARMTTRTQGRLSQGKGPRYISLLAASNFTCSQHNIFCCIRYTTKRRRGYRRYRVSYDAAADTVRYTPVPETGGVCGCRCGVGNPTPRYTCDEY
jgi:hypothetical protein